ncbi:MAG: hypothetical protein NT149_03720 [Candidatus Gottesmanbacteria bacterium]|nr:hypothetical protein [Candidatus Gottesmanbacteria bacterium]
MDYIYSGTADNYIAGNVGIGTTSPGQKLEVADASDPYIRVHQLSTAIGAEAGIIMQSHTTNNYLSKITGKRDGTSYGTGLSFYTTNDIVGQTLTEKMTILSNGKVGIGTTAPATALEVNGTVDATLFTGPLTGHASLDATIASPNFTGTVVIPSPFTLGGTSVTASAAELNKLDSVTTTATQLNYLNAATGTTGTAKVVFQASPTFTGTVVIPSPFTLGGTSVTANGTELNILDGVTGVTAAELTALGGITANATEINILDTVTGLTAAELTNLGAVTATAAELNTVDTASSITTLLSAKAPLASPRFTDNVTLTGTGIFSTAMGSFGPSGSNLYINPSVSADVIFNMGTGNVGIGMAAPTTPFEVGSGTTPYFAVSSTNIAANIPASTNTQHLCSTGTGWQAIKVCNGGTDYAEYYGTTPNTEAGDLVSYDPAGQFKTIKSTGAYDPNIIGAISTFPNDILGEANPELNTKPVALKGRVPVKVNLENGPIKVGDWLAASSVPGVAMKATKNSMVIGRALEDYDGSFVLSPGVDNVETLMSVPHPGDPILSRPPLPQSGVGKIMVFIELSEHITQLTLTDTGDLNIAKDQTGNYIVEKTESTFVKTTVDKVEAFAEVVVGNVRAGIIETKKLIVDGIDVAAKLSELSGRIDRQEQTIRELQTELEQVKAQQ